MEKSIIALGIETSCDDTSIGISKVIFNYEENIYKDLSCDFLGLVTENQQNLHKDYGGIVPEIAARAHAERIDVCLKKVFSESMKTMNDIDIICVTAGPGLIGGLLSGINFAKGLSFSKSKPLVGVNHLIGHALTPRMTDNLEYPYLLLLASGGHCQYLAVLDHDNISRIGTTIDDAPGEVFDKVAKMLNLPTYSGSEIEKYARLGDKKKYSFPCPLLDKDNCDLSFSGLKSAVRRKIDGLTKSQGGLYKKDQRDICASFQESMKIIFENKTKKAFEIFRIIFPHASTTFSLAGGVASNLEIRTSLKELCKRSNVKYSAPPVNLCADNGLMIAFAGSLRFANGKLSGYDLSPKTRWPIDTKNHHTIGFGRRGRKV